MAKQDEFDVRIQATGIDIHRKVDERIGRRIVSILIGGEEIGDDEQDIPPSANPNANGKPKPSSTPDTREKFFAALQNDKPSDNALAIAAYHYSQYGSDEFTVDGMRELADDVGVTVPERLDMTYLQAKRTGNRLFRRGGKGAFRPTVHGEAFFKETYKVSKGTNRRAVDLSK